MGAEWCQGGILPQWTPSIIISVVIWKYKSLLALSHHLCLFLLFSCAQDSTKIWICTSQPLTKGPKVCLTTVTKSTCEHPADSWQSQRWSERLLQSPTERSRSCHEEETVCSSLCSPLLCCEEGELLLLLLVVLVVVVVNAPPERSTC